MKICDRRYLLYGCDAMIDVARSVVSTVLVVAEVRLLPSMGRI